MKNVFTLAFCWFFFIGGPAWAETLTFTAQKAIPSDFQDSLSFLRSLSPRPEGSSNEERLTTALEARFKELGLNPVREGYWEISGAHSFSTSLSFTIPGKKPDRFLIVTPLEGDLDRPNNAGVAWATAAAAAYQRAKPSLTLTFLFLGAERDQGGAASLSSRQFLSDFFPSDPAAVLYLDCSSPMKALDIVGESGAFLAPSWFTGSLLQDLKTAGFSPTLHGTHPQIFRLDIPEKQTLLAPWFQRNFPSVLVQENAGVPEIDFDKNGLLFLSALNSLLSQYADGLPSAWDRHYLYFEAGNDSFFLSQGTYLLILLFSLGLILIYFSLFSSGLSDELSSFARSFWQLPVYFFFLFLFLVSSTLVLLALFQIRKFETFWQYAPLAVLAFKILFCVAVYNVFFLQMRRMPLSRWPGFYSYAALVVLTVEVLAAAAVELSFSFYFLWALVFAALFHLLPWRPLRYLAFFLAPLWFVIAALELFWLAPDPVLYRFVLVSPVGGNFVVAGILFPFLLLANSFHYLRHQRQERNEKHLSLAYFLFWMGLTAGLTLVILRYNPFQNRPVPLDLVETIDLEKRTTLLDYQSPSPRKNMQLVLGDDSLTLQPGLGPKQANLPFSNSVWETRLTHQSFLGRFIWTLHVHTASPLRSLDFVLTGPKPFVLFGSSFPYQLNADGRRARIFVGRNPPQDFDLTLTLDSDAQVQAQIRAQYAEFPFPITLSTNSFDPRASLVVLDKQDLTP